METMERTDFSKIYDISNGITLCRKCHMKIHKDNVVNDFLLIPHKISNQHICIPKF
jgi:hypothetical protein